MRAWIFSDLHIEMDPSFVQFKVPAADVCICAGDVLDGGPVASVLWLSKYIAPHMPVVFVPGNHEYYRSSIKEGRAEGYKFAKRDTNIFLLDGDTLVLGDYRFVGATLWTDFDLHHDPRLSKAIAREALNDYRRIKFSKTPFRRFTPHESQRLHHVAVADIDSAFVTQPKRPTVVISHHAPSLMSVPVDFLTDKLTPAFASRLEHRIIEQKPILWVHGHIHAPSDYFIEKTRVICNPLGYPGETSRETFVPNMVIDLAKLSR